SVDPSLVILGHVELLQFAPGRDGLFARCSFFSRQEFRDEVDVAAVRDLFESFDFVQADVLADKIAVSGMLPACDLFLPPTVQAIPDAGFLAYVGGQHTSLFDDEVFRLTIAGVVFDAELQTKPSLNVLDSALAQ